MRILGIETSCDETAAAVVEDGVSILSNRIASQIEIHARYGGVVPEVASRQHILAIIPVVKQAMADAGATWSDLGAIAVTVGPGLAGSLLIGVNVAKAIALAHGLPVIGVNHLEGHIYANWLAGHSQGVSPVFPLVCLIVSGGHSDLVLMKGHQDYVILGRTRDDAAGEAFDKAARILDLGYPGGPAIERAAAAGSASIRLPRAWLNGTNDFSFSGVKTALLRLVEGGKISTKADAAASFQEAVVDVLVGKTMAVAREYRAKQILLAGGVAANESLRQKLVADSPVPVLIPPMILCTDNAAMVAACGYYRFQGGRIDGLDLDVVPGLRLA
ncbi:MAG: tRNA (adenosine(37)-N6)-threonylcarbamoyltransferase complex transferase subunit TsaD [Dehalococcoidales bacterium]|nr:tRNA (adenosine(37)-N6)-threonylcarbamoyltransferase complex transferase subunit TsaD [Dehalococcoidales bacterium]MDZ4231043.1 tRNA (adenosine(37)-N6)-threonylcarbamoyltransferase complex transferase subunit TsaD [Dehalococcoidales bacterium]